MLKSSVYHVLCVGVFLLSATIGTIAVGDVRMPRLFGDNMVLQREIAVPIWGWAEPGEKVTIQFADQNVETTAGPDGRWQIDLAALQASADGRDLVIAGANTVTFTNVVVGEVWICSGQSNMEWTVGGSANFPAEKEAADFVNIRHVKIPHLNRSTPDADVQAELKWVPCSPQSVGGFTAVGYFFGRELHHILDVPVGLIGSNWGGTRIEPWTPPAGFRAVPELKQIADTVSKWDTCSEQGQAVVRQVLPQVRQWLKVAEVALATGRVVPPIPRPAEPPPGHQAPTKLYNGMISPLVPFAIRGAIWYQGESNGGEGESYFHKMQALVRGWRNVWDQGEFPFYYVQLANFQKPTDNPAGGKGWAKLREAQVKSLSIPNTGMAVTIDIGNASDIHPKNKQDVGKRLARWALAETYGKDLVYSGPLYREHQTEGDKIRVFFDHPGSGLCVGAKEGLQPMRELLEGTLERFAVAGDDRRWHWADAVIDGDSVVVSSPAVPNPVAVRYAFSMNPQGANLYNREGLPASPFRTDGW